MRWPWLTPHHPFRHVGHSADNPRCVAALIRRGTARKHDESQQERCNRSHGDVPVSETEDGHSFTGYTLEAVVHYGGTRCATFDFQWGYQVPAIRGSVTRYGPTASLTREGSKRW